MNEISIIIFFCFMHNCFTGIFTTVIVYGKSNINLIVSRIYKHICNLFPPATDDEHGGVWNMSYVEINLSVNQYEQELGLGQQL